MTTAPAASPAAKSPFFSLRFTTETLTVLSLLPHLFCCVLPITIALISLGTTVGLGAALMANPFYNNVVHAYHKPLLIAAVVGVVLSGILNYISYRIDCRKAACGHADCTPKKSRSFRIFYLSLFLLALDLAWFAAEEHILGVEHSHFHGHAHADEGHSHADHNHTAHNHDVAPETAADAPAAVHDAHTHDHSGHNHSH